MRARWLVSSALALPLAVAGCSKPAPEAPQGAALTQLLTSFRPAELRVVHHEHMADVVNTDHSVQVNAPDGDTLTVGQVKFVLLQYHFHSPSEHHVDGRPSPAEMHLVHKAADGRLAVIGVLFEEGAANPALDPIWANLPTSKGEESHLAHLQVNVDGLLPASRASYRYTLAHDATVLRGRHVDRHVDPRVDVGRAAGPLAKHARGQRRPVQPLNRRALVLEAVEEQAAR